MPDTKQVTLTETYQYTYGIISINTTTGEILDVEGYTDVELDAAIGKHKELDAENEDVDITYRIITTYSM